MRRIKRTLLLGALVATVAYGIQVRVDESVNSEVAAVTVGVGAPAYARVGRPLTPVSVAGVARRTSRRTARRND